MQGSTAACFYVTLATGGMDSGQVMGVVIIVRLVMAADTGSAGTGYSAVKEMVYAVASIA